MKPSSINSRVLEYMHAELLTPSAELTKVARIGLILVRASDFLDTVAFHYGAEGVFVVNEFYRNFIGQFDLVCVETRPHSIRFCNQIDDGGQDGVQLSFVPGLAKLSRLSANFGTTTFTQLKEYVI